MLADWHSWRVLSELGWGMFYEESLDHSDQESRPNTTPAAGRPVARDSLAASFSFAADFAWSMQKIKIAASKPGMPMAKQLSPRGNSTPPSTPIQIDDTMHPPHPPPTHQPHPLQQN